MRQRCPACRCLLPTVAVRARERTEPLDRTDETLTPVEDTWNRIRNELRASVSDSTFEVWIDPLRPSLMEDGVLVVEAPETIRNWVESRFTGLITEAALAVRGIATRVEVTSPGKVTALPSKASGASSQPTAGQGDTAAGGTPLDPKLTFDQFVISERNRLAHAAALAAAEMPSQAYNPLFIHGPPGTGKTHLLHAIGNLAVDHTPDLRVRLTTAEEFTARFVESIRRKETAEFKSLFRDVDLLLVDDAQFLAGKTRTGEEFFHTFNNIVESGAQVVLTCDRIPSEIEAMEQRLRDRFASGLVVDVAPPDIAGRTAILSMRVRRDGLGDVPNEALEAIATGIRGNVRALEGALIRVVAYASLTGTKLTREVVGEVLEQLYPGRSLKDQRRTPGSREIKEIVAKAYGLRVEDLDSRSRAAQVVWPRQVAMYLAREVAGEPLPQIGAAFGGRNHSTVLNACRRVRERVSSDPGEAMTIKSLERRIVSPDDRGD